jgi:fructose-bisphosphate aldolase class I
MGRYAALCQEQGLVPIVEPEVLRDGAHPIERCEEITGKVLNSVFNELYDQGVLLEAMLLKPNMIVCGNRSLKQASVNEGGDANPPISFAPRSGSRTRYRVSVGRPERCTSHGKSERE